MELGKKLAVPRRYRHLPNTRSARKIAPGRRDAGGPGGGGGGSGRGSGSGRDSGGWRWWVPALLALVGLGALLLPSWLTPEGAPLVAERPVPFHLATGGAPGPAPVLEASLIPVERTLRPGETLSDALAGLGMEPVEAHTAIELLSRHLDVRRLRAGEAYYAYYPPDSAELRELAWPVGDEGRVSLQRTGDGWSGSFEPYERRVESRVISGELEGSLIGSIERAGAPEMLAYRMAEVLQWDLDFNRDLRLGDRFRVLYEEVYLDGAYHGLGNVLALTYDNAGRRMEAFRFGENGVSDPAAGYYDAQGRPVKKMFLRSPLRFSRVTSRFSHRRFHPVLKRYRPHYGVDYGAPVGTPVRVTANGVVTFAGRNGGAGRMVKVRHPNDYLSAYLHLSRFARGVRPGRRVAQGEVIGYVGSTGLSTGPHLDYRVQHRGRWVDPLSIKSVPAEPIPAAQRPRFEAWRQLLQASLEDGAPLPEGSLQAAGGVTRTAEAPAPEPGAAATAR